MPPIVLFVLYGDRFGHRRGRLRQRQIRVTRTIDLQGLVTTRLADPAAPILATALERRSPSSPVRADSTSVSPDPGDRQSAPSDARRVRGEDLPAPVGQRLRDAREGRPRAPLPTRSLGGGAAPEDGRDEDRRRARRGADGGRRRTGRRAGDRSRPRLLLRRVPRSGADPHRRADRRPARSLVPGTQEAEGIRQDAVDRVERGRPPGPLLLPVRVASVLLVASRRGLRGWSRSPG